MSRKMALSVTLRSLTQVQIVKEPQIRPVTAQTPILLGHDRCFTELDRNGIGRRPQRCVIRLWLVDRKRHMQRPPAELLWSLAPHRTSPTYPEIGDMWATCSSCRSVRFSEPRSRLQLLSRWARPSRASVPQPFATGTSRSPSEQGYRSWRRKKCAGRRGSCGPSGWP
jgi:hypothetical protein